MSLGPVTEMPRLALRKALSLPKDAGPSEDRWAVCPSAGRVALCDGASEGWDGRGWAGSLSRTLARWGADSATLGKARAACAKTGRPDSATPHWLDEKARARGSWSTALLLETGPQGRGALVSAIGDTTLFVLDGFKLLLSFPMKVGDRFGSTPDLVVDTPTETLDPPFRRLRISLGSLHRPSLVLATDALAARLLGRPGEESGLFRFLRAANADSFAEWAGVEVAAGRMAFDDLTLLWVG